MPTESTLGKIDTATIVESWIVAASHFEKVQRLQESRSPLVLPATVSRGGMECTGMCRDISKGGIGILQSEHPPVVGRATVAVWLRSKVIDFEVDIVWVKRLGNGWWAAGGRRPMSSLVYARLALSRIGTDIERRYHRRHLFFHPFSVYANLDQYGDSYSFDPGNQDEPAECLSLDVSLGGIRLLSETYFQQHDQIVHIRRSDSKDPAERIRGRIVSCQELPNGYYATGIQFAASRITMTDVIPYD